MILNYLKKHWYYIVMLAMLILIVLLYKKPEVVVEIKDTKTIERLRRTVDSLTMANIKLQADYDAKQTVIIDNTIKKNKQDAKTIFNIPKLNNPQRDSMWTVYNTSQDSIPGRYWDILKQKTGGRNIKEFAIQTNL